MNYITSQYMITKERIAIEKQLLEKNQIYCINQCCKKTVTTSYNAKKVFKNMQNLMKSFQTFREVQYIHIKFSS